LNIKPLSFFFTDEIHFAVADLADFYIVAGGLEMQKDEVFKDLADVGTTKSD